MRSIHFKNIKIDSSSKAFVIAEIGNNAKVI